MNKYVYKGGLFDKTASVARACLSHFDKYGVLWQSPDAINASTIPGADVQELATGNKTLVPAENGKTIVLTNVAGQTVTLPKIQPIPGYGLKLRYRIVVGVDVASGSVTITPAATDIIKGFRLAKTAGQTWTLAAASDAAGDYLELVSDGVISWWASGRGTWA
jgi:hypothetical protein